MFVKRKVDSEKSTNNNTKQNRTKQTKTNQPTNQPANLTPQKMNPPRPSIATHEVAALANFVAPRRGLGCPMMELDKTHLKTIFNLWILMKERNIHNRIVALREKNYIFVYDIYSIFAPATLQLSDTVHWVAKINNWSTVVSATEIGLDGNWRKHLSTRK